MNRVLRLENRAPPKKQRQAVQPTQTKVKVFRRHRARLAFKENPKI